ncbi:MAG: phosphate ABC transporter substrate-binding protein [Alphaproteobacteria bacterium]|nr:phosphate ABC transporter substrate-binding protein [Alphaproteobacteria bacterium]
MKKAAFSIGCLIAASLAGESMAATARKEIRVVGSSTVYPFSAAVAERYVGKNAGAASPVVESTGTGAGIKLFCAGVGAAHPDIVNASRRLKASEYADCAKNGVKDVVEIQIGIDGIAFAEAVAAPGIALSIVDIYKALAATPFDKANTAKSWKDVNPALPDMPILVYGPPTTSGTRDALTELILEKGCDSDPAMKALKDTDKDKHKAVCTKIRTDGAYVEAGEQDNLIVQKIATNPKAIGVFGYGFLEENTDKLKGVSIGGVAPIYDSIASFTYPGARPLYIYVKAAHLKAIKGLTEYVAEWTTAWSPTGYLKRRGMVVAPDDVRAANATIATSMTPLDPATLK